MEDAARPAVPAWYWVVAVLGLLWEGMGCFSYLAQVGMMGAKMGQMPAEHAEVWKATPVWVWCAFAVAASVGLAGALLLLLRHRLARAALALSLLAAIVQFGWAYLAAGAARTGAGGAVLPLCIIAVGAFLVWFAGMSAARGWLR